MRTIWKAGLVSVVCTTVVAGIALAWHASRANRKLAEAAAQTRQRAEQGDAQAQVDLAHLYYYGEGVPRDYAEAAEWER